MDTQGLVSIVPWTFVAQICNLLIQMLLIKRFLIKPIHAIIDKRKAMADAVISDAEKEKDEAEALKEKYEHSLTDARTQANAIVTNAQKTATVQSEEILQEASRQAASIKAKAESDIEQERRKAVNEIKDEIGTMAVEIAGKVIEREISEEDHTRLIDDFIASVGDET